MCLTKPTPTSSHLLTAQSVYIFTFKVIVSSTSLLDSGGAAQWQSACCWKFRLCHSGRVCVGKVWGFISVEHELLKSGVQPSDTVY